MFKGLPVHLGAMNSGPVSNQETYLFMAAIAVILVSSALCQNPYQVMNDCWLLNLMLNINLNFTCLSKRPSFNGKNNSLRWYAEYLKSIILGQQPKISINHPVKPVLSLTLRWNWCIRKHSKHQSKILGRLLERMTMTCFDKIHISILIRCSSLA